MSTDYFIITPPDYGFEMFIERFPSNIKVYDLENGSYNIQADGAIRNAWISMWNYKENGFKALEDAFTEEQMISINRISNPKFFCITAGHDAILNTIISMIADDPNVLICDDTNNPIIPGDEFVARLKSEEKT